jgi:hypothetical protein
MNKEQLIESAMALKTVKPETLAELSSKQAHLVAKINQTMLERPDIKMLVGENNLEMMKDNHANHAKFVYSILQRPNAQVLVATVLWVFRSYRSRGFHQNYWSAQLNTWINIFKQDLSQETCDDILPLYDWFIINIPHFTNLSDSQLEDVDTKH